jgi:hypothetical protein
MRDAGTELALADIRRGVPRVYIDYLGYDEYAHRRGPDSELALYNLRGIDRQIGRLQRAIARVPQHRYELWVLSDHGQTATIPFEWVCGRDLSAFVFHLMDRRPGTSAGPPDRGLETFVVRQLVELRALELWIRTLYRPLRPPFERYARWLKRRLEARLGGAFDGVEVVTGGSIAHLYFGGRRRLAVEALRRRHPRLLDALIRCPAIGLVVAATAAGPTVFYRGRGYLLSDRRALERLWPFRRTGYRLLADHLRHAATGGRHGDLVLYGAFAAAGDVAFDFEFGSHGGVGPDELSQFVIHPADVTFPLRGAVRAEDFYRFFRARYGAGRVPPRDSKGRQLGAA